ncbi:hypothetical protein GGU11DRAFT_81238 [Lentinula aff. detonsa]|nr:hypothetical protein GGU11DRAFT_81238 [Lentinula aff. detonsa]
MDKSHTQPRQLTIISAAIGMIAAGTSASDIENFLMLHSYKPETTKGIRISYKHWGRLNDLPAEPKFTKASSFLLYESQEDIRVSLLHSIPSCLDSL